MFEHVAAPSAALAALLLASIVARIAIANDTDDERSLSAGWVLHGTSSDALHALAGLERATQHTVVDRESRRRTAGE